MSLEKTINALVQKYKKTSWDELITKVLYDQHFKKALNTLMENHKKGIKFSPGFNDIFYPFSSAKLNEIKVVVVYPDATSEHQYVGDNVFVLRSPLTVSETSQNENVDEEPEWEPFIRQVLDEIAYRTTKTIFVFVGKETEKFKGIVRKGQYKMFVASKNPEFDISKVHDAINDLLKKIDKEPIDW